MEGCIINRKDVQSLSENKRYYWYKMKTDFFDEKIIKFLRLQSDGDTLVLLFQQIMLYSLKTDGYLYYEQMLPTFGDELALAINAKSDMVKALLDILLAYGAIIKTDDNTYYISFLEDCVGSETRAAARMRNKKKEQNENISPESENFSPKPENFSPEIEKEKSKSRDRVREDKNTSAFSFQKKSGSVNVQNVNFQDKSAEQKHNSAAEKKPPQNYEIEAFLKRNNLTYEDFMPSFVRE